MHWSPWALPSVVPKAPSAPPRHFRQPGRQPADGNLLAEPDRPGGEGHRQTNRGLGETDARASSTRTEGPGQAGQAGEAQGRGAEGGLAERAREVHSVLDPIAQGKRTTAVLRTDGGDIISGGRRDLSPAQRALQREGEILAKKPGVHAETVKVLEEALCRGLIPIALEVTRDICSHCLEYLHGLGATITGPRSALWKR